MHFKLQVHDEQNCSMQENDSFVFAPPLTAVFLGSRSLTVSFLSFNFFALLFPVSVFFVVNPTYCFHNPTYAMP